MTTEGISTVRNMKFFQRREAWSF